MRKIMLMTLVFALCLRFTAAQVEITIDKPPSDIPQYGMAEFVIHVSKPVFTNPFTEITLTGRFASDGIVSVVNGFADSQDGSLFRLRYSPEKVNSTYSYVITFSASGREKEFSGSFKTVKPVDKGPVVTDPAYPKHFIYKGTGEPFIHLGCTEYHLLDISNDDAQIASTIEYCRKNGFNKIRFLLTGYPRDFDNRKSDDNDHGVPEDPWKSPNYGSLPGRVNPLPAWLGAPHKYDFTRFNVAFWQKADRAVQLMKENGIVATCIIMIEKQNLPAEIGKLTDTEYLLYKYAASRLSAYNNVWWDIGNEHNEYRDAAWGDKMGNFLKENDPHERLASAHAYENFFYSNSGWADFIITQQYGTPDTVHKWALKYYEVKKPYVNEEYGYEGLTDKPVGHGMNRIWIRKCHWAIAMAGGYGTYGDWSNGISYFYMGIPGTGKAVTDLNILRSFLESVPFREMKPSDSLTSEGYCMSVPGRMWIFYLPDGGTSDIDLTSSEKGRIRGAWFNPVTGKWGEETRLARGSQTIKAPSEEDWIFLAK